MLKDVQSKIDELDGASEMANTIAMLEKRVKELENELKNKGASKVDLQQGKHRIK